jgi:hypothetical protein
MDHGDSWIEINASLNITNNVSFSEKMVSSAAAASNRLVVGALEEVSATQETRNGAPRRKTASKHKSPANISSGVRQSRTRRCPITTRVEIY